MCDARTPRLYAHLRTILQMNRTYRTNVGSLQTLNGIIGMWPYKYCEKCWKEDNYIQNRKVGEIFSQFTKSTD